MPELPLVSIVTPTYNMAHYLRETVDSVLSQDYPRLEYLVMDAGSQDGTVELLRSYGSRLRWVSEPDNGQADAINKGFRRTSGEIFAFLNADDLYLPGAVSAAVRQFQRTPEAAVVYGEAWYTDRDGKILRRYPTQPFCKELFQSQCYICQPASFMRRHAFEAAGGLDARLHYALDYDLWMRLAEKFEMVSIPEYLATSRMYSDNKTIRLRRVGLNEIMALLKRSYSYIPPHWVYAWCSTYLHKGTDGFFVPDPPTPHGFLACVVAGTWFNRARPFRYWRDCAKMIGPGLKILYDRLTAGSTVQ